MEVRRLEGRGIIDECKGGQLAVTGFIEGVTKCTGASYQQSLKHSDGEPVGPDSGNRKGVIHLRLLL